MNHRLMIPAPRLTVLACAALGGAFGCSDSDSNPSSSGLESQNAPAIQYYSDVAPILQRACVSCHQDNGVAPFSLTSHALALEYAEAIGQATRDRTMPPWPATADGTCQTFLDVERLTDDEIAILQGWVSSGGTAGDPVDDAGSAPPPRRLEGDALSVKLSPYTPQPPPGKHDAYRCFSADPSFTSDGFVTAAEVVPSAPELVHHVAVYAVDPQASQGPMTNADAIRALEDADGESGWDCYGSLGDGLMPRSLLTAWAPGAPVLELPTGLGLPVGAQDRLVVQVHYRVHDEPRADASTVRLKFEKSVPQPVQTLFRDGLLESVFTGDPYSLAPGEADERFQWELPVTQILAQLDPQPLTGTERVTLYGVYPHMHTRGTRYQLFLATADGAKQCGLEINEWDFHWQRAYLYETPLSLDADSKLVVRCSYDTTQDESPVLPGHDEGQEMCSLIFYAAATP